jgi:DNA-binding IclR family transcriptional regulator
VGDLSPGISAVSSPVFDHHRKVLGCVILVGTFPEGRVEAFGRKAALTAQRISRGLGVMADPPWKRVPPQIQKASPGGKEA